MPRPVHLPVGPRAACRGQGQGDADSLRSVLTAATLPGPCVDRGRNGLSWHRGPHSSPGFIGRTSSQHRVPAQAQDPSGSKLGAALPAWGVSVWTGETTSSARNVAAAGEWEGSGCCLLPSNRTGQGIDFRGSRLSSSGPLMPTPGAAPPRHPLLLPSLHLLSSGQGCAFGHLPHC